MIKNFRRSIIILVSSLFSTGAVLAQVGTGWTEYFPTKSLQQENSVGFSSYTDSVGIETFTLRENPERTNEGKPLRQRCEIRIHDDYTTGTTQFQGEFYMVSGGGPDAGDDVCIMQVWLSMMVSVSQFNGGSMFQHSKIPIIENLTGKWIKINVFHDADHNTGEIWINGEKKWSGSTKPSKVFYHKYGLYNEAKTNPEVKWRNIRYFRGGTTKEATPVVWDKPTTPAVLPGKGMKKYDFFYAGEQKNRNMYIVSSGRVVWSYIDTAGRGEISDAVLLSNGDVVFAHQHGLTVITKDKKIRWNYDCPKNHEIHTAQPIGKNHVIFIENSDTARVRVVNLLTGKIVKEFQIPVADPSRAHGQFRHARLTKRGTYLIAHMDLNKICEYDSNGKTLLSLDFPSPWSAEELSDGNILAVCNKNIVREINRQGKTIWEFKPSDVPEYKFFGIQTAARLKNGNTLINNWYNQWNKIKIDPANMPVQFMEVTPDKKVVWVLREWNQPNLGPSTIIQLLDSKPKPEDVFFGEIK